MLLCTLTHSSSVVSNPHRTVLPQARQRNLFGDGYHVVLSSEDRPRCTGNAKQLGMTCNVLFTPRIKCQYWLCTNWGGNAVCLQLSGVDSEPLHLNSAAGALLTSVDNRSDLRHSVLSKGFHVLLISSCTCTASEDLLYKSTNWLPEHSTENKFNNHTGTESIQW